MRSFPIQFAQLNQARARSPRVVIAIRYETASVYFTSHDDIASVPGVVVQNVVREPSAISQKLVPDEGRSEIGAFSFSLVDLNSAVTDAIRDHLSDGFGPRAKEVRFYIGYDGMDFTAFQRFTTQIIQSDDYDAGVYSFKCDDITREQNKEVFKPFTTTLRQSCTATDTTIAVSDTTRFQTVAHDASYTDGPSSTVGYFRLEDEITRYTGKTADTFTGCTRGVLNTVAKPHAISDTASADRQPKIEEFIYLEGPGPKLAFAVLTGELYGTANTLPDHWNLGFDPTYVREAEFVNIGKDLWDTADLTKALILRFEGLKAQDGKRFLEREIFLLLGCYSPVYSDGTVGLRRMAAVVADAAPVLVLTEDNLVEISALEHDGDSMHNQFRVRWAWDAVQEAFIRESRMIDGNSITAHGTAPLLTYEFRGLHGERHTDATLAQRLDSIRDRYNEPPLRLSVTIFGSLNGVEIGDIARIAVSEDVLRDYTADPGDFNRSFEVQQMTYTAHTGAVRLELFGSTARPITQPATSSTSRSLPDAFYTAVGAALSSAVTMSGNNVQPGTYTLTGNASLANSAAVFYHDADLTILDGATINIVGNVYLRVKGFITCNGDIVGTGGGKSGVSDPGTGAWDDTFQGNPGFIGNSRGWDGVYYKASTVFGLYTPIEFLAIPAVLTKGAHEANGADQAAWPVLNLEVSGNTLLGPPTDLRGSGGAPGGRVVEKPVGGTVTIRANGGTGGDSGAGLCIVCRGFAFGASGSITLDGENTAAPSAYTGLPGSQDIYPGAGGPGTPGAFLLLLDGNQLFFPTVAGKFFARAGALTQPGNTLEKNGKPSAFAIGSIYPASGYADPIAVALSGFDYSTSALRIQYIPETLTAESDPDAQPPAPTALTVTGEAGFNAIRLTLGDFDQFDSVELWASLDNDRANAVKVGEGLKAEFKHELPVLATRYYWARTLAFADGRKSYSDWFPSGATAGISATTVNPGNWTPVPGGAGGATVIATASTLQKSGGTTAWDSDCYSLESYTGGAYVSFRAAQTNADFMLGLNSDPTTNQSYTSIDYAFNCQSDGTLDIYEAGSAVVSNISGGYNTSTVLLITHDNINLRYLRNGTVVRTVPLIGATLFLDSSFYTPGAKALDVKFGPQGAAGANGVGIGIRLSATAFTFTFDGEGNASPGSQTITFTATRTGIATATTWTTTPTVTLGGSGDTRTLTIANFGANTSVKVRAEADGYFDEITVVRLSAGTDTVVGFLTNEAHTVRADAIGNVLAYTAASGIFKVYFGATDVTATATFSVQSNPQSLSITGPTAGTGAYSITGGFDATEDLATVTFRAVYLGRTIDRIFSLAKAGTGESGAGAVFQDTFDHQNWPLYYNDRANGGGLTVTYPANGVHGGRVLTGAGGQLWIARKENIPFDPNVLYKITASVRRTAAGSGDQFCYVGVEGVAADGTTLINTSGSNSSGSQHYNCFSSFDLSAIGLNTWVTRACYFKGNGTSGFGPSTDPTAPGVLYTGVRYIRPLVVLNYNAGNGTEECDFIRIDIVTDTDSIAPDAASQIISAFDGVQQSAYATAGGSAINTDLVSATLTTTGGPIAIDAMATVQTASTGNAALTTSVLRIYRDGSAISSTVWDAVVAGIVHPYTTPVTVTATDAPSAGSHTYAFHYTAQASGTTGSFGLVFDNKFIKIREIKR